MDERETPNNNVLVIVIKYMTIDPASNLLSGVAWRILRGSDGN